MSGRDRGRGGDSVYQADGLGPQALYELKGQVVTAGIKAVTGLDMPSFPKRRFQHGAGDRAVDLFPTAASTYRQIFQRLYESAADASRG